MKKTAILMMVFIQMVFVTILFSQNLNESFESPLMPSPGWTVRYADPNPPEGNLMIHSDEYSYSGEYAFRFSSWDWGDLYDQYLITPRLVTTAEDRTISFYYRRMDWGMETFRVGWSVTGTNIADFQWSEDITNASERWQQFVKNDLPAGNSVYVCIHYRSEFEYYLYVDTVVGPAIYMPEAPPGPAVALYPAHQAENVPVYAALRWQATDAYAQSYDIYFGNPLPDEPNVANSQTIMFQPGFLTPETTYFWKIVPKNRFGAALDCPVWSFRTGSLLTIEDYPHNESFERVQFPPLGWNEEIIRGNTRWQPFAGGIEGIPNGAAHGNLNALFFSEEMFRGDRSALISPLLDLSGITYPMIKYSYALGSWFGNNISDILRIYANDGSERGWRLIAEHNRYTPEWTQQVFFLPDTLQAAFLRFEAAGNWGLGVVLDNIIVQESPGIPFPTNLTVTEVTNQSAALGWRENGRGSAWNIELGPAGFQPTGVPTHDAVAENPYTVRGLQAVTAYDFYVRVDDDFVGQSVWSGPKRFLTGQIPALLPVSEGFEGEINWTIVNGNAPNKWYVSQAVSFQGERSAYISQNGGLDNTYNIDEGSVVHLYRDVLFPEESERDFELSFWWRGQGEGEEDWMFDYLKIHLIDTDEVPEEGSPLVQGQIGTNINFRRNWTNENFILEAPLYLGQRKRLVFTWVNDWSIGTQPPAAIDNIILRELPEHPAPRDLHAANIRADRVLLGWRELGNANLWEIELGEQDFEPTGVPTVADIEENRYLQTGLEEYTSYQFYVRSVYGGGIFSEWAGPGFFTTTRFPAEVPFFDDFEGEMLWDIVNEGQPNKWYHGLEAFYAGERSFYISNTDGRSYQYNIDEGSVVHFYKDIEFPDANEDFNLSFWWKGMGEGEWDWHYDYLEVFLTDTNISPRSGEQMFEGRIGSIYNMQPNWTQESIHLPAASYRGQVKRLIFSWVNDWSVGMQPPAAIDNVRISNRQISPHPTIATEPTPADGAESISRTLRTLSWSYHPDHNFTNPVGFRIYFNDSADFGAQAPYAWVPYVSGRVRYDWINILPGQLEPGINYYWKVVPTTILPVREKTPTRSVISKDGRHSATEKTDTKAKTDRVFENRRSRERERYANEIRGDAVNCPVWSFTTEEFMEIEDLIVPFVTELVGNYPNPFNPVTSIGFSVKEETSLSLNIYNLKGQLVKELHKGVISSGHHRVLWDSTDKNGKEVGSGLYLVRMKTEAYSGVKKILLVK